MLREILALENLIIIPSFSKHQFLGLILGGIGVEILGILGGILSIVVAITALITFVSNRAMKIKDEATQENKQTATIDLIKIQNDSISIKVDRVMDKTDNVNIRLVKIEEKVNSSALDEIPKQLATMNESLKNAHKRIDKLENQKNK